MVEFFYNSSGASKKMNGAADFIAEYLKISLDDALLVQAIFENYVDYSRMTFKRIIEQIWNEINKK